MIHSLYISVYKCTCIIKTFIFLSFTGQVQWLTKALSLFQYLSFYKLDNIIGDGGRLIHTGSCCSGRYQWLNRARNPRSIFRYLCSWNIVLLQQQSIYQWPHSFCLHIFTVKYEKMILHVDVHLISSPRFITDIVNSCSGSSILLGHFIFQEFICVLILSSLVVMSI